MGKEYGPSSPGEEEEKKKKFRNAYTGGMSPEEAMQKFAGGYVKPEQAKKFIEGFGGDEEDMRRYAEQLGVDFDELKPDLSRVKELEKQISNQSPERTEEIRETDIDDEIDDFEDSHPRTDEKDRKHRMSKNESESPTEEDDDERESVLKKEDPFKKSELEQVMGSSLSTFAEEKFGLNPRSYQRIESLTLSQFEKNYADKSEFAELAEAIQKTAKMDFLDKNNISIETFIKATKRAADQETGQDVA